MSSVQVLMGRVGRGLLTVSMLWGLSACGGKVDLSFIGAPGEAGAPNVVSASCGNRVVDDGEECDDGDRADGDGCDGTCAVEAGWTCTGEPSMCVKCGNGALETGEDCDDGNNDDGDGCSKDCKIEGSCAGPIAIPLKADKDGLVGSVTSMTSKEDVGQVDAADCGGAMVGAGADRIFEFELPDAADLDVSVGSNFDAVVRLTTTPCDLTTELPGSCADQGAVAEEEHIHVDSVAAGKYYVVVDGKTAQQAGSFSVNVEARCPLSGLKIDRIFVTEPFRTLVLNTNTTCGIDLSRVGVYAQPQAADGPKTLPAITLDPLKRRILTSESPPPNGTTYQGNIPFDAAGYAGAYYLCSGECDTTKGTNVIDAVRWNGDTGKPKLVPLAAVSFDANVPALPDRTKMSFFRVAYGGTAPNFTADDFQGAFYVETFEDSSISNWEAPAALFYTPKFDPVVKGTIGSYSLELSGYTDKPLVWNGPKFLFKDGTGMPTSVLPSYVSLRVRASTSTLNHGWAFFGNQGSETSGFGSFFRGGKSLGIGATGATLAPVFALAILPETWHLIEYQNFTYMPAVNPTSGKVDVYVDGKLQTNLTLGTATITQIALRNYDSTAKMPASAWFDQIIVR